VSLSLLRSCLRINMLTRKSVKHYFRYHNKDVSYHNLPNLFPQDKLWPYFDVIWHITFEPWRQILLLARRFILPRDILKINLSMICLRIVLNELWLNVEKTKPLNSTKNDKQIKRCKLGVIRPLYWRYHKAIRILKGLQVNTFNFLVPSSAF
jgi:hypothetical protein